MKKCRLYFIGTLLFVLFQGCVQPQSIQEEEVISAVAVLNKALVNPEKGKLEQLTSGNLSYGHSSGILENQEQFINALLEGPFDFLSIDTSQESILISGNTAVARHIMTAKGANNGEQIDVHIGIMLVFQKIEGKLVLLARQAYKL